MGYLDAHLNCCKKPSLSRVKSLYERSHDSEALDRCEHCKAYWFRRFHEWIHWDFGDEEQTVWLTRLRDEEAEEILRAEDRDSLDLTFLEHRESLMDDEQGVRFVEGQPSKPFA